MHTVFKANGRDLRVEGEISAHGGCFAHAAKDLRVAFARQQQANRWALQQAIHKVERNPQFTRGRENLQMRHDPHELRDAENWQPPGAVTFG